MIDRPRILKGGTQGIPASKALDADATEATDARERAKSDASSGHLAGRRTETVKQRVIRAGNTRVSLRPAEFDYRELVEQAAGRAKPSPRPEGAAEEAKSVEALQEERDRAWQARLDQAVNATREEAYTHGYADASAQLTDDFEAARQGFAEDVRKLRLQWERFLEDSKPLLVELSFEIAQAVLDTPLSPTVKGVSARALTEAVEQLAGSTLIEVALHPVDFLRIQESGLVEQLESLHAGIRWEPRSEMKPGDWAVQSPVGAIRRLETELLGTLKGRLGLLAVAEKRSAEHPADQPPAPESND